MNLLRTSFILAGLCMVGAHGSVIQATRAFEPEKADKADTKRKQLWQALNKVLPKKYQDIDAYAENASLTSVLFYSKNSVLKFTLDSKKLEEIPVMKVLGRINRITFEKKEDGGEWVLWQNGRRELTLDDQVDGIDLTKTEK